jgi:hypothetical protein
VPGAGAATGQDERAVEQRADRQRRAAAVLRQHRDGGEVPHLAAGHAVHGHDVGDGPADVRGRVLDGLHPRPVVLDDPADAGRLAAAASSLSVAAVRVEIVMASSLAAS